ncbi:uncharacterized protein BYT42DRAFT_572650 [Radiomyces spectabilis]|uniref:uncharacterized protein n=1 Tax=Radiomyces spectabilis TaxID=64574 RepID=UPI0022206088|nr:uncharacterized protein BYT42DRAFT_572650 [Radiomyces spectabilis]KAI8378075.1 hypothetical protein BYT42DRAFT_572650 [Radiomyces spectabilis]
MSNSSLGVCVRNRVGGLSVLSLILLHRGITIRTIVTGNVLSIFLGLVFADIEPENCHRNIGVAIRHVGVVDVRLA